MKRAITAALLLICITLSACASPNGAAAGNNNGSLFTTNLFKIPLP